MRKIIDRIVYHFKRGYYERRQQSIDRSRHLVRYNPKFPYFDNHGQSGRNGIYIDTQDNSDKWRKKMMELCDEHAIEIIRK